MDPDAPQSSEPTAPPETSDEDAPVIASPSEPAPQPSQTDAPQVPPPEPSDEDTTFLPSGEPNEPLPPVPDATPPVATPPEEDSPAPTAPLEPAPTIAPTPSTPQSNFSSAVSASTNHESTIPHETVAPKSRTDMTSLSRLGLAKRRQEREARLAIILALAAKKGHILRTDVQLALTIPKRTAEEYLEELVAQGRLSRRGKTISTEYWAVG